MGPPESGWEYVFCLPVCSMNQAKTRIYSKLYLAMQALLKVVGNEKGGGLGGWLLFEDGFGPWRLMSVCFLTLLSSFLQQISISCL